MLPNPSSTNPVPIPCASLHRVEVEVRWPLLQGWAAGTGMLKSSSPALSTGADELSNLHSLAFCFQMSEIIFYQTLGLFHLTA